VTGGPCASCIPPGPVPYLPKPTALYQVLEVSYSPRAPNLVSADDTMPQSYWKAVRQATAPCFSYSNLKQVRDISDFTHCLRQYTMDCLPGLLHVVWAMHCIGLGICLLALLQSNLTGCWIPVGWSTGAGCCLP